MTREYSNYIKGIAILMMLWLHLFTNLESSTSLGYLLAFNGVPLIHILTRICNPVPFFLFLSGYGLYATYTKRGGVNPCKKVCSLYAHLWIIYLLLVPLASYIKPESYPGSLMNFLKNATSWQCSYIGAQWFFLPYIILMITSKYIFTVFDKLKGYWVLIISLGIYTMTIVALKIYGEATLDENMLFYNIFLSFSMLFPFSLGYLAKKYMWVEKLKFKANSLPIDNSVLAMVGLIGVCVVFCFVSHNSVSPFFSACFILLFSLITVRPVPGKILTYLGKHSMNIWLIHTWFCTRLFHEFFYDKIHYPILMFLCLLAISLVVSHLVEWIYKPIGKFINK